jgi:hypothetical protein
MFALAVLLATGAVSKIEEGLGLLRGVRPAIRLSSAQIRCVEAAGIIANQSGSMDVS